MGTMSGDENVLVVECLWLENLGSCEHVGELCITRSTCTLELGQVTGPNL